MAVLVGVETSDNILMTEWVAIFRESWLRDDVTVANLQDACLKTSIKVFLVRHRRGGAKHHQNRVKFRKMRKKGLNHIPGENPQKIHQKPYTTLGNFGGSDFGISRWSCLG